MTDDWKNGAMIDKFLAVVITITIFSVGIRIGYQLGSIRNINDMGYIGCNDGHLTMRNFLVDNVPSAVVNFGAGTCAEDDRSMNNHVNHKGVNADHKWTGTMP